MIPSAAPSTSNYARDTFHRPDPQLHLTCGTRPNISPSRYVRSMLVQAWIPGAI
jgi:hypothetical protein